LPIKNVTWNNQTTINVNQHIKIINTQTPKLSNIKVKKSIRKIKTIKLSITIDRCSKIKNINIKIK
jgi:subtilisin-like proprotein convertase family protein